MKSFLASKPMLRFLLCTTLSCMLGLPVQYAFAVSDISNGDQQKKAALRALMSENPAPADSVKDIALAEWTHGPADAGNLWVVAALIQPSSETDSEAQLWTGLLRRDNQGFHLLAEDRSERVDTTPILWNSSLAPDLIPYRINDHENAFGVRFSNDYTSTAHSDTHEEISLYRYTNGRLVPIFSALTDTSVFDKDGSGYCAQDKAGPGNTPTDAQQEACDAENTTGDHYVLSFSPHTTDGYYDLVVRAKGKPTVAKAARFTWNGKSYQPRRFQGGL